MKLTPFEPGRIYHIFNRGNNKENIFKEEKNYSYFLLKADFYLTPVLDIYSYCLMPNHFHIITKIKDFNTLPKDYQTGKKKLHQPLSNLFNSYTKSINKSYNRTGSLFQKHPQRINVNNEEHLREVIVYTHLNPVKHKFTIKFEDYPHSSYKALVSKKVTKLDRGNVIELFENVENFKFCHNEKFYKNLAKLKEIEEMDY